MKKLNKVLLVICMCIGANSSYAATLIYQNLDSFEVRAWTGGPYITPIAPGPVNPEGCLKSHAYKFPNSGTSAEEFMQTVALGAQMSGRSIRIALYGCLDDYPKVHGIWVTG